MKDSNAKQCCLCYDDLKKDFEKDIGEGEGGGGCQK